MPNTGFYETVQEHAGVLSAMFVTADQDAPLAIITQESLGHAFLPKKPGTPFMVKPNAFEFRALLDKGVPKAEIIKAFADLSDPDTAKKARKGKIADTRACCDRFARAAGGKACPKPARIGAAPACAPQ